MTQSTKTQILQKNDTVPFTTPSIVVSSLNGFLACNLWSFLRCPPLLFSSLACPFTLVHGSIWTILEEIRCHYSNQATNSQWKALRPVQNSPEVSRDIRNSVLKFRDGHTGKPEQFIVYCQYNDTIFEESYSQSGSLSSVLFKLECASYIFCKWECSV